MASVTIVNDRKLLWENPNPTTGFAQQEITLSSDDYSYLEIYYACGPSANTNVYQNCHKVPKGFGTMIYTLGTKSAGVYVASRIIAFVSNTKYLVYSCTQQTGTGAESTNNNLLIPQKVYGIK